MNIMDDIHQKHLNLQNQIEAFIQITDSNNIEAQKILSFFQKELNDLSELSRPKSIESPLSNREQQVLNLIAQGQPNKEIAYQLSISPKTVQFHIKSIFNKLEVGSRTEAATKAIKLGIMLGDS